MADSSSKSPFIREEELGSTIYPESLPAATTPLGRPNIATLRKLWFNEMRMKLNKTMGSASLRFFMMRTSL